MDKNSFFERVYEAVILIPKGKVTSYGEIAKFLGAHRMSRHVGFALHVNPRPHEIPCHRVVNREGYLSGGFAFGGMDAQKFLLNQEGVEVSDTYCVDLEKYGFKF